jgi:hypothetical protein
MIDRIQINLDKFEKWGSPYANPQFQIFYQLDQLNDHCRVVLLDWRNRTF